MTSYVAWRRAPGYAPGVIVPRKGGGQVPRDLFDGGQRERAFGVQALGEGLAVQELVSAEGLGAQPRQVGL